MTMYGHCAPTDRSVILRGPEIQTHGAHRAAHHDRHLGTDPVEEPAADLRGDGEAGEEDQQVGAGVRRRPTQRQLRVHAGEEEQRDEHHLTEEEHPVLDRERPVGEDP